MHVHVESLVIQPLDPDRCIFTGGYFASKPPVHTHRMSTWDRRLDYAARPNAPVVGVG